MSGPSLLLTCQHDGEEQCWEIMVEVENSSHEEKRQVVKSPSNKQPSSTGEELVDITCPTGRGEGGGGCERESIRMCVEREVGEE